MIEKIPSWARDAIIYHIYPLGYCDCPSINPIARTSPSIQNLQPINRICKIRDYYDYFRSLGINTIYLGPLFESCTHGYDVINYFQVDRRLGANQILKEIINELHSRQIKVILDGVFHHTSRLFPCFVDIKKYKQQSKFISWYQDIDFHKDTVWQDGFSYKTYLDHVELPVLNLHHPDTQKFIHKVSNFWIKEFDIDGWRLDVAHHITPVFWQNFQQSCRNLKPSFLLIGELTDQDYNLWINPATLDTATNYQLYEHIWQSFNQQDFWQLKDIINRERNIQKGIYANLHLTNFVGNHDTSRIYNLVHDKENIELIFTFLFTYPGIPCLYYGDEILLDGKILTNQSKYVRQPMPSLKNLDKHQNEFLEIIKQLIQIRKDNIGFSIGQITILSCDHHHFAYQITHKKDNYIIVLKTKHDHKTNQIYFKSDSINNHQFINLINQEKYQIIENILHFPNHAHRLILKQI